MENVTYICPECGEDLEYDENLKQHFCKFCREYYEAWQIKNFKKVDDEKVETKKESNALQIVKMRMFSCKECNAEMLTMDEDESKTCPYCGSKDFSFVKTIEERKPDQIVPFMKSKEDALKCIQGEMKKAKFIGNGIETMRVVSSQAVYIPFWSFDTSIDVEVNILHGEIGTKKLVTSETDHLSKKIVMDASKRFDDNIASRLKPYDLWDSVPFEQEYLKDALVECTDDAIDQKREKALKEGKNLLKNRLAERVSESSMQFKGKVKSVTYFLLPVYFFELIINGTRVLMLVNGQTGKVVGNAPVDQEIYAKKKEMQLWWGLIGGGVGGGFLGYMVYDLLWPMLIVLVFAMLLFSFYLTARLSKKKNEYKDGENAMVSLARKGK